jgi:hydrogenase/urease accessory protein HupE
VLAAGAAFVFVTGRRRLSWPEAAILLAVLLLPVLLSLTSRFFWAGPVTLAAMFGLSVLRAIRPAPR